MESNSSAYAREAWLLEEYKLLSAHYFHEDTQLLRVIGVYGTLNGALIAFLGSKFVEPSRAAAALVPIIGIVLCFSWIV